MCDRKGPRVQYVRSGLVCCISAPVSLGSIKATCKRIELVTIPLQSIDEPFVDGC